MQSIAKNILPLFFMCCLMNNMTYIKELQEKFAYHSDMKAYESLYKLLYPSLFRFSYSFVKSHSAAEELVSDVFIKVWEMASQLQKIENLKAYLFTLTKNLSINYLARSDKRVQYTIDSFAFEDCITWRHPEDIFISGESIDRINQAINNLPPQCRIIFQLVKIEGLSYQETADVLELSLPTVRNQVTIGVKKLLSSLPALQPDAPGSKEKK